MPAQHPHKTQGLRRRELLKTGFPKGFKAPLTVTGGYGPDLLDAVQLAQRYLKEVGIEAELKIQ